MHGLLGLMCYCGSRIHSRNVIERLEMLLGFADSQILYKCCKNRALTGMRLKVVTVAVQKQALYSIESLRINGDLCGKALNGRLQKQKTR